MYKGTTQYHELLHAFCGRMTSPGDRVARNKNLGTFAGMKIQLINGPNINLLGRREPEVYGNRRFEDFLPTLQSEFPMASIAYFQSNTEGAIVDKLHEVGFSYHGIVLNAGGYTHTSIAIHDAIGAITTAVVEVHISNIYARESFRHKNIVSSQCAGSIVGLGLEGYALALTYFVKYCQAL